MHMYRQLIYQILLCLVDSVCWMKVGVAVNCLITDLPTVCLSVKLTDKLDVQLSC